MDDVVQNGTEDDLEAIQAHMAMTMALAYDAIDASMKNSSLPDEVVQEALIDFRPRPPRLGLGAVKTTNKLDEASGSLVPASGGYGPKSGLSRETARLHGRLAGKKRRRDDDEEGQANATTNGTHNEMNAPSDDEESRAATISKTGPSGSAAVDRFALPGKKKKRKPPKEEEHIDVSRVVQGDAKGLQENEVLQAEGVVQNSDNPSDSTRERPTETRRSPGVDEGEAETNDKRVGRSNLAIGDHPASPEVSPKKKKKKRKKKKSNEADTLGNGDDADSSKGERESPSGLQGGEAPRREEHNYIRPSLFKDPIISNGATSKTSSDASARTEGNHTNAPSIILTSNRFESVSTAKNTSPPPSPSVSRHSSQSVPRSPSFPTTLSPLADRFKFVYPLDMRDSTASPRRKGSDPRSGFVFSRSLSPSRAWPKGKQGRLQLKRELLATRTWTVPIRTETKEDLMVEGMKMMNSPESEEIPGRSTFITANQPPGMGTKMTDATSSERATTSIALDRPVLQLEPLSVPQAVEDLSPEDDSGERRKKKKKRAERKYEKGKQQDKSGRNDLSGE